MGRRETSSFERVICCRGRVETVPAALDSGMLSFQEVGAGFVP